VLTIYTNSIRNSVPLTSCRPRRTPVLGPSHTQTQRHGVLAMMIRPYKPRDSARSALLTAVRNRRSGPWRLAVHPRRVLHGPAAPDWRGEIRVGRTRDVDAKIESGVRLGVAHVKVPGSPVILGWAGASRQAAPTQGPCLRMLARRRRRPSSSPHRCRSPRPRPS